MTIIRKTHPLIKIMRGSLIELPTPVNISTWWNFGSLLGLCLTAQIITGLFLAMHYTGDVSIAFERVVYIIRDVNYGWLIRVLHANGASLFFICLFIHVGRGVYYSSFLFTQTWIMGVVIMISTMATAFIGYVLPWGQMSFWGATVITNLLSAVPIVGEMLVQWIWGGFAVDRATLTRFFSIHFIMPFIISAIVIVHLLFLHQTGSNNPLGIKSDADKISFHPFFSFKDVVGFLILVRVLAWVRTVRPYALGDSENFIPANPLVTPPHIQPEWYFLFAYAILRSVPNKLGGVIALLLSILILTILPYSKGGITRGLQFYPIGQTMFWFFVATVLMLTWIGARPVEEPYIIVGQILTVAYFSYFLLAPALSRFWDSVVA